MKVIEVKVNVWIEERSTKEQESRKANWRLEKTKKQLEAEEKRGVQEKAKATMTRQATPFPATTTQSPGCLYTPPNITPSLLHRGRKGGVRGPMLPHQGGRYNKRCQPLCSSENGQHKRS
eukprot:XP_011668486.1 PREDICTED: uncharacterized protein LOC105440244 isoform X2 [Strongylocentrotus purpuratus]